MEQSIEHDAEKLNRQEFLQMDYPNCLRYLGVYFLNDPDDTFSPGKEFNGSGELGIEVRDKFKCLIKRKLIKKVGLWKYRFTDRGWAMLSRTLGENHSEL